MDDDHPSSLHRWLVGNIMDDWMDRGWAVIKVNLILGIAPAVLLLLYSQQFIRESRLIGAENEKRELFNRSCLLGCISWAEEGGWIA